MLIEDRFDQLCLDNLKDCEETRETEGQTEPVVGCVFLHYTEPTERAEDWENNIKKTSYLFNIIFLPILLVEFADYEELILILISRYKLIQSEMIFFQSYPTYPLLKISNIPNF